MVLCNKIVLHACAGPPFQNISRLCWQWTFAAPGKLASMLLFVYKMQYLCSLAYHQQTAAGDCQVEVCQLPCCWLCESGLCPFLTAGCSVCICVCSWQLVCITQHMPTMVCGLTTVAFGLQAEAETLKATVQKLRQELADARKQSGNEGAKGNQLQEMQQLVCHMSLLLCQLCILNAAQAFINGSYTWQHAQLVYIQHVVCSSTAVNPDLILMLQESRKRDLIAAGPTVGQVQAELASQQQLHSTVQGSIAAQPDTGSHDAWDHQSCDNLQVDVNPFLHVVSRMWVLQSHLSAGTAFM